MKKLLFLSFFVLFIFSCKSEKEKTEEKLKTAVKSIFEDIAFKNNEKLIFEFISFEFREVGENTIDSSKLIKLLNISAQYNFQVRKYHEIAKNDYDVAVLSKNSCNSAFEMHMDFFEQYEKIAQKYIDSINSVMKLDSTIRVRMKENTDNTLKYYLTKSYCNIWLDKENIKDTLIFYFNKDFTVLDLSKNLK